RDHHLRGGHVPPSRSPPTAERARQPRSLHAGADTGQLGGRRRAAVRSGLRWLRVRSHDPLMRHHPRGRDARAASAGGMTEERAGDTGVRMRALVKEMAAVVSEKAGDRPKELARIIWHEPFAKRTWSEFWFLTIGTPLAVLGLAFVVLTLGAGVVLAITFFGLAILALSVRGSRGLGGLHRQLARGLLGEEIDEPEPFVHRPGFLGWLQPALRDRTGWRSMAYVASKVPLAFMGIFVGFSMWWDAFYCITYPIWGGRGNGVAAFGIPQIVFGSGVFSGGQWGCW